MSFWRNLSFGIRLRGLSWALVATAALPVAVAGAAFDSGHHGHDHAVGHEQATKDQVAAADPHAHHRHMMKRKGYSRTEHDYDLPDLAVVAMDGTRTTLLEQLNSGQPVMVNFIFTTCTTICPIMSASFSNVQEKLGEESDKVRMVSVSIDPEHDTPERLREYARRFNAGPQWQFLTGDLDDMIAIQKAFDVYRGNKMNHEPTTLLRRAEGGPWVRLDGLASAAAIVDEYGQLSGR